MEYWIRLECLRKRINTSITLARDGEVQTESKQLAGIQDMLRIMEERAQEASRQQQKYTIKVYHRVKEDLREKNPFNSRAQYLKRWIWRFMEISSKEWEKRERSRQQLVPTYILGAP
ncbi:hypothetical protein V6N12_010296 [Hibiscus sabdariffa]|uniref:Uncharacterized protein n=1 Tax=Hibiscus sabdariffa TaxID=183260 RepID=A0ABR2AAQ6_9ROSI